MNFTIGDTQPSKDDTYRLEIRYQDMKKTKAVVFPPWRIDVFKRFLNEQTNKYNA